jgi:type I restriction enzyme S subunit
MSFPRYPTYKDSGVEWLDSVPEHWTAIRLKNVLAQRITDGPHLTPVFVPDGVPFLSVDSIQNGELTFDSCRYVSEDDHIEFSKKVRPQRDDVLMGKAASTGKIARVKVDFEFSIWSPLALIRVDHRVALPSFVEYALKSPQTQAEIDVLCTSNTQKNISMDDIPKLALARPPIDEQAIITEFLDRETAKIDALVAEQEQLITLLKEKRQAVISHAVTKGLDPSVPMKDSGVEWLGEVPAHWKVMPIRLAARLESGHTPSRSRPDWWLDCTVPWFSLADVWQIREAGRDVVYETKEMVSELGLANSSARLLPKGTVMLSRTASVGFAAIMGVDMATTQDFANWVCGQSLLPEFLLDTFKAMKPEFNRMMMGSTHNTIYMPDIQAFRFALPSMNEQAQIVAYVRDATAQSDELIAEAKAAVSLLKERRSALISAAVTGQIDVRGLAPAQEQAA